MATVGEATDKVFKQVRLDRKSFMIAAHFFDVHIGKDGIHCYYMWRRNDFRFPIYHPIKDMLKRSSRNGKSIDDAIGADDKNVFIPLDSIQGVVTYSDHKEIQLLSTAEQIYFLFRDKDDYEKFISYLQNNLGDKYFTRDNIEIKETVHSY